MRSILPRLVCYLICVLDFGAMWPMLVEALRVYFKDCRFLDFACDQFELVFGSEIAWFFCYFHHHTVKPVLKNHP